MSFNPTELKKIITLLQQGEIIACPTEGVFGLSCDATNERAVLKLLALKKRPIEKGLILITDKWETVQSWIGDLKKEVWEKLNTQNSTPTTWVVPVSS